MQTSLSSQLVHALSRLAPASPAKPISFSANLPHHGDTHAHGKEHAGAFFDTEALSDPKRLPINGPIRRGMIVDIFV